MTKPAPPPALSKPPPGPAGLLRDIPSADTAPETPPDELRRPWWLFNGHLETWYSQRKCAGIAIEFESEHVRTPDSDSVLFRHVRGRPDRPLLIVFHGLEGGSDSPSVRMVAGHFVRLGWSVAVPHFRTCGMMNRLPRAYHAGDSAEIGWMAKYSASLVAAPRTHAVGISLGGNALAKWLGEGRQAIVQSAAAVCAPLDLERSAHRLGRWLNRRLYAEHFLRTLLDKAEAKARQYPYLVDVRRLRQADSLRKFDDAYTAPVHGFDGADDYYRRASAKGLIAQVSTRLLCINPRNDPLVPHQSLPRQEETPHCVTIETPRHGGHLGFVSAGGKVDWLPRRLERFFTTGS